MRVWEILHHFYNILSPIQAKIKLFASRWEKLANIWSNLSKFGPQGYGFFLLPSRCIDIFTSKLPSHNQVLKFLRISPNQSHCNFQEKFVKEKFSTIICDYTIHNSCAKLCSKFMLCAIKILCENKKYKNYIMKAGKLGTRST